MSVQSCEPQRRPARAGAMISGREAGRNQAGVMILETAMAR